LATKIAAVLYIDGAATVEIAVLLGQHERIDAPGLAHRLDDVEVGVEEHRFCAALSLQAHDDVHLVGAGTSDVEILVGEARRLEAPDERLGRLGRALRVRRVGRDELGEDVVREPVVLGRRAGRCRRGSGRRGERERRDRTQQDGQQRSARSA